MKHIADDELTLLYYGEQEDPALAALVANSPELSARFETLCSELEQLEALIPPEQGEQFGAEVWRRISPQLVERDGNPGQRWKTMLYAFRPMQISLAGAASIAVVAALAFMLGRQGWQPAETMPLGEQTPSTMAVTDFDSQRLMTTTVADHLEQLNIVFTQFVNSSEPSTSEAERATDMLVANRLYRQAAITRGENKLAAFLGELEPLLIEMAYEAYKNSPNSRERMQREVSDGLLFRVRIMNKQLRTPRIST